MTKKMSTRKKMKKIMKELNIAYAIFVKINLNHDRPNILKDSFFDVDYAEFMNGDEYADLYIEYNSFGEVITDIRRVFLNIYTYFGVRSKTTTKLLLIEEIFDNSISQLNKQLQRSADVQLALDLFKADDTPDYKFLYPKGIYDSALLRSVAYCRPQRLKQYYNVLGNMLAKDEQGTVLLKELLEWKTEICFNNNYHYTSSTYELLEIGHFILILFGSYDFKIVHQGEIERMFLIPKESTTMCKIMTVLLNPVEGLKHDGKILPYEVWSVALSNKVSAWYEVYHKMKRCKVNVFKALGIHPDFWAAIGDSNPLLDHDYCELPYIMKVWLVKGLCDHVFDNDHMINDIISKSKERQCTIWKNENGTEEYFYFQSMPDLRLYYIQIPCGEPDLEFLKAEKIHENMEGATPLVTDEHSVFQSECHVQPKGGNFKLIADSVQAIRSFIEKLVIENKPESLINALEELLDEVEPFEANILLENNVAKINIYKDWKSHFEKTQKIDPESVQQTTNKIKQPENIIVKTEDINFDECQSQEDVSQEPVNPTCSKESNNTCDNSNIQDNSEIVKRPENCNSSVAQSVYNESNKQTEQDVENLRKRKTPSEEIKNSDNLEDLKTKIPKTGIFIKTEKEAMIESNDQETEQLCNGSNEGVKTKKPKTGIFIMTESNDPEIEQLCNGSNEGVKTKKPKTGIFIKTKSNDVENLRKRKTPSEEIKNSDNLEDLKTKIPKTEIFIKTEKEEMIESNDQETEQLCNGSNEGVKTKKPKTGIFIMTESNDPEIEQLCNGSNKGVKTKKPKTGIFIKSESNDQEIEQLCNGSNEGVKTKKPKTGIFIKTESNDQEIEQLCNGSNKGVKTKKPKTGIFIKTEKEEMTESNDQETEHSCNGSNKKIKILSYWSEGLSPSNDNRLTAIDNKSSNSLSCNNAIATSETLNTTTTESNDQEIEQLCNGSNEGVKTKKPKTGIFIKTESNDVKNLRKRKTPSEEIKNSDNLEDLKTKIPKTGIFIKTEKEEMIESNDQESEQLCNGSNEGVKTKKPKTGIFIKTESSDQEIEQLCNGINEGVKTKKPKTGIFIKTESNDQEIEQLCNGSNEGVKTKKPKTGIFIKTEKEEMTESNDQETEHSCNGSNKKINILSYWSEGLSPSNDNRMTAIDNKSSNSLSCNNAIATSETLNTTTTESNDQEIEQLCNGSNEGVKTKKPKTGIFIKTEKEEMTESNDQETEHSCNGSNKKINILSYWSEGLSPSNDNRMTAIDNKSSNSLSCNNAIATSETLNTTTTESNDQEIEQLCNGSNEGVKTKKPKTGIFIKTKKEEMTESNDQETEQSCNGSNKKIKILSYWSEGLSPSNDNRLTAIDNKSSNSLSCNNAIATSETLNTTIIVEDKCPKVNVPKNTQSFVNQPKSVNITNTKKLIPKKLQAAKDINQSKMNVDIEIIVIDDNPSSPEKYTNKTIKNGTNKTTTTTRNDNVSLIKNKINQVEIVISDDDEDDVQILSYRKSPKVIPASRYKNPPNTQSASNNNNKQLVPTNRNTQQAQLLESNSAVRLSSAVSNTPININKIPENNLSPAAMKQQQPTIAAHYNVIKIEPTVFDLNISLSKPASTHVNVKCKVVSRPSVDGEIQFSVRFPNGHLHPMSNDLINQYLKEHNNTLPHYWMIPLAKEVAKKYGC